MPTIGAFEARPYAGLCRSGKRNIPAEAGMGAQLGQPGYDVFQ